MTEKYPKCAYCGMLTNDPAEYHPWIVCALFRAGHDSNTIRANLFAVLDHGRRLERHGLPNDALITDIPNEDTES